MTTARTAGPGGHLPDAGGYLRGCFGLPAARSTPSRMNFSATYETVRSSDAASSCNAVSSDGAIRTPMFTFFSDSGSGFRGMAGSVNAVACIWFSLFLLTPLTR